MASASPAAAARAGDLNPVTELALEGLVVVAGGTVLLTVGMGTPLVVAVVVGKVGVIGTPDSEDVGTSGDGTGTPEGSPAPPGTDTVGSPGRVVGSSPPPSVVVVTVSVGLAALTIAIIAMANTSEAKRKRRFDKDLMLGGVVCALLLIVRY